MTSMQIRDAEPERDAAALVALTREVEPFTTMNVSAWIQRERSVPKRAQLRAFVAELDGEVIGESWALLRWWGEGTAMIYAAVREEASRRGIGSALYDTALAHALTLDAVRISSNFFETPVGVAFAIARGFEEARADQISSLDPRTVTEEPLAELLPATQVDPRVLHHIDETSSIDMPSLEPHEPVPYDEWAEHVLERPLYQPEGSFVAYADGKPAALSMLTADLESGRGSTMYTGTLPQFRGRGLALAAKIATLRWAAEHGVTRMAAMNDETNAPMLAINRRLGFTPAGRRVEYVKEA